VGLDCLTGEIDLPTTIRSLVAAAFTGDAAYLVVLGSTTTSFLGAGGAGLAREGLA
jgi:hypothetical protein